MVLSDLNKSQRQAVESTEGSLLVLAGAGSGKTRVIISKILYLIHQGVPPSSILAITFTNKAAKEMKGRLEIASNRKENVKIGTFHSLGLDILKEEHSVLGYRSQFSIFNDSDQETILKEIYQQQQISEEEYSLSYTKYTISSAKNKLKDPQEFQKENLEIGLVYEQYQKKLKNCNAVDFDDLIFLPIQLFKKDIKLQAKWSQKYQYILVDEYQDTNYSQYYFVKMLSQIHGNICVVGDDDQSIYKFRGADIGNILRFKQEFSNAKIIVLDRNYRNSPLILRNAYKIIENNKERHPKHVESIFQEEGDKIVVYEAGDVNDEAQWIAAEIFSNRLTSKIAYHQQAILCRTNSQMRVIEKHLRMSNIPYVIIGGYSFYDRSEVKTVLAYLKLIYNPYDIPSFYRAIQFPKRGIGSKTIDLLFQYAVHQGISYIQATLEASKIVGINQKKAHILSLFAQEMMEVKAMLIYTPLDKILENLYERFEFRFELSKIYKEDQDRRLESLDSLISSVKYSQNKYQKEEKGVYTLQQFLQDSMMIKNNDEQDESGGKAFVITIHSAKGLEYEAVFIPGFEERTFPHAKSLDAKQQEVEIEEERRLCYVAFTRAKKKLFLSYAQEKIRKYGKEDIEPSRFLNDLDSNDIINDNDKTTELTLDNLLQDFR